MLGQQKELPIIISVGGGLIVPNGGIDTNFLKKLNTFIRGQVKKGKRFFLVAGGGRTARHYRDAGKAVSGDMTDEDLDWLGVHATHLNGHLLRTIFQDIANPRIIQNYDKKL
jgi:uridylate kinase